MKTHLLWLLLLTLLGWSAEALKCYECTSTENCLQPTICDANAHYCLTIWNTPPGLQVVVIKACAYTCPGVEESLVYSRASCCNTDLCNGASSHLASWGLLLVLSVWCFYSSR
uniref:Lymphocyte antigen 6 family member M n=1 Tax=Jaculus jaculus TaxID=51337 RepID=A0A8C5L0N5_JACJA|nr:lymphocyte antigen 6D-like [Jaculus jaculus]